MDGQAVRSCLTPVSATAGKTVITVEGLGSPASPHPIQQAFIDHQVPQCGYCTGGIIMSTAALLERNKKPTEAEIRTALEGNLCRCGTHVRVIAAVTSLAQGG
jgi:nicotinate dehydrogenase subunit A